jgi:hypothetical protein
MIPFGDYQEARPNVASLVVTIEPATPGSTVRER